MSTALSAEARLAGDVEPAGLAVADKRFGASLSAAPTSYDKASRTVELVAATDTPINRGAFTEILQCVAGAVDLSRVQAGQCPLLDSHTYDSITDQLGGVIGSRFEGGALILRVRFSDTAPAREAESRVAAGDLTGVSVGYQVREQELHNLPNGAVVREITAWELLEVSLVAVPADVASGVRSAGSTSVRDPHDTSGMVEALVARMQGRIPAGRGRPYRDYRAIDFVSARAGVQGTNTLETLQRAAVVESDIGLIFSNAANKALLSAYATARPQYRQIAVQKRFKDFKPTSFFRVSEFPALLELNEDAEAAQGPWAPSATRETITLATAGRRLTLSRRAILDDDLNAFGQLVTGAAKAAVQLENQMFASLLALNGGGGPTLSDGQPMFSAAHGNIAAAGDNGVPSVPALSKARTALRRQKDLDGRPLDVTPRIIYAAPEQEEEAEEVIGAITPLEATDDGGLRNRYQVAIDNYLPSGGWYVFADPVLDAANFAYGFLGDADGPEITERTPFTTDGVSFRVAHDFAVGAIDWRFAYLNRGAS